MAFLENNGEQDWPSGCSLQYVSGDKLTNQTQIPVPPLPAMAQTDGELRFWYHVLTFEFSISWTDVARPNWFIQYKMEFGDVAWCTFWRAHLVNSPSWGRRHFDCHPNDWPNVKIFKIVLEIRGIDLSKFKIPIYPISFSFDFVGTILLIPPLRLHIF